MKKTMKINWGVDFNTNNYERIIDLDVVVEVWKVHMKFQKMFESYLIQIPELDKFIDEWFYENISQVTSCDDEFIKDRNNVYFTDYVRYILVD